MRTIQKPGEYIVGFLKPDGSEYCQCRCPNCWHYWEVDSKDHIEILTEQPVKLVCPLCRQEREYIDAVSTTQATPSIAGKRSKVRAKGAKVDPPLFSGLDPGYDLRHKRID